MARYQVKPNGEIVLIFSPSESRGLEICAREGYVRLGGDSMAIIGNQVQKTATQRAIVTLQMAIREFDRKASE